MPFRRSRSGPRKVVNNSRADENESHSKGSVNRKDKVFTVLLCVADLWPKYRPVPVTSAEAASSVSASPKNCKVFRLAREDDKPKSIKLLGSTSPCRMNSMGDCELSCLIRSHKVSKWSAEVKSVLVTNILSAMAICFTASVCWSICPSPCKPSTKVMRPSSR